MEGEGTYTGTHSVGGDGVAVQVIWSNCLPQFTNQSVTWERGREKEERQTDLEPIPRKIISEQLGIEELWAKYIC